MTSLKPLNSILVKPAGPDCNMVCDYCFYRDRAELFPGKAARRMDDAILREMIRTVMEEGEETISFGWQGGEPTLMGVSFYEKAVEYQRRYGQGKTIGNGIQTNGLLIDNRWGEFLYRNHFLVGLSIDGPRHVHERYRRMAAGGSSWETTRDAAKLLLDKGVAVNALSVVTGYSAEYPEEIYGFLKDAGLTYMQFIPCLESDPADRSAAAEFSANPEQYGDFLCRVFDLWISDFRDGRPATSVRMFESLLFSYAGILPPDCDFFEECGVYLVVEHNGDVFSCDFFVEPECRLGNLTRESLKGMLNSGQQRNFGMMKKSLPESCRKCKYLTHCRGGCVKDRTRIPAPEGINYFCRSYKMLFSHAGPKLRAIAEKWQTEQDKKRKKEPRPGAADTGRNDPCPCGSGRKYKKCCGSEGLNK